MLAIQLIALLILLPTFIRENNWFALIALVFVAGLLVGDYKKNKIAYILTFIWSILLIAHALILLVLHFHYAYIIYLIFAAVFVAAVSQSNLK
jgi:hypothetical protein